MSTLETRTNVEPSVGLHPTPLLRLRLRVLQASRGELQTVLADAIAENPCIEESPWDDVARHSVGGNGDPEVALENLAAAPPSMTEELLVQLRCTQLSPAERRVGEFVIGNLDDDGFLDATIEEIAVQTNVWPDLSIVERVVACVQEFDPPGIGARDRPESFVLQLRRRGLGDASLPVRLVREYLSAIVRKPVERVATMLGVSTEELQAAARLVARLDPSPGRGGGAMPARVVPDVTVSEVDGDFVVSLNEDGLPRLELRDGPTGGSTWRTWRRDAEWLLGALAQRRETLRLVSESVVRAQRDFLEGRGPLRPLVLRDVAGEIGRHESTVSRAVADKYVETPHGLLPLKAFFARRASAGGASAARVKDRIRELVAGEDTERPLSDDQIMRQLRGERLHVSRRTVGKYREELCVPPAARRRGELQPEAGCKRPW
jgi:RNA polymerase sigma-54 factor